MSFIATQKPHISKRSNKRVPNNANEQYEFYKQRKNAIPIGNLVARQIKTDIIKQVSPQYPYQPSKNWATEAPTRGWNQNDLNTYIIRESAKHVIKDFDRFILKEDTSPDNPNNETPEEDKTLAYKIQERIGKPRNRAQLIKQNYRDTIQGQASVDIRNNEELLQSRKQHLMNNLLK